MLAESRDYCIVFNRAKIGFSHQTHLQFNANKLVKINSKLNALEAIFINIFITNCEISQLKQKYKASLTDYE